MHPGPGPGETAHRLASLSMCGDLSRVALLNEAWLAQPADEEEHRACGQCRLFARFRAPDQALHQQIKAEGARPRPLGLPQALSSHCPSMR